MEFSISRYIDKLSNQLRDLSPQRRAAFGAWCAEKLLDDSEQFLSSKAGPRAWNGLRETLDEIWTWILGGSKPTPESVSRANATCLGIHWDEEDDED